MADAPRVFLSYSHDSDEHADRVLSLADALCDDGIDVILDRYVHPPPEEGWPLWMDRNLNAAKFVLMICTETYLRRVLGQEEPGKGAGVRWEGKLIYNRICYDKPAGSRFIPILLAGSGPAHIPDPIQGHSHYQLAAFDLSDPDYEALYRHLTDQPATPKPDLGSIKKLPPRPRPRPSSGPLPPSGGPLTNIGGRIRGNAAVRPSQPDGPSTAPPGPSGPLGGRWTLMTETFAYDVFLSHSTKDKPAVREVARRLKAAGLRVWLDEWEIKPGDPITSRISDGLEQSRILLFFMSENAFSSEWAALERDTALFRSPQNADRRFIPLRLDDAPIKLIISNYAYIDWRQKSEEEFAKLLEVCRTSSVPTTLANESHQKSITSRVLQGHTFNAWSVSLSSDNRCAYSGSGDIIAAPISAATVSIPLGSTGCGWIFAGDGSKCGSCNGSSGSSTNGSTGPSTRGSRSTVVGVSSASKPSSNQLVFCLVTRGAVGSCAPSDFASEGAGCVVVLSAASKGGSDLVMLSSPTPGAISPAPGRQNSTRPELGCRGYR